MGAKFQTPRGTRDIIGREAEVFHDIESACRSLFLHYGYQEVRTPTFESRDLFERSVGGETDIVTKELYGWDDSKGRRFALRPEGTAGVVRAYIENNLSAKAGITKLFYAGQMFRHERPQEGRYREFWQIGCELFGGAGITAEAETIELAIRILDKLSIPRALKINHLGCDECRRSFSAGLVAHFSSHRETLCESCVTRLEKNPLRLLDCKSPVCGEVIATAPPISLCEGCAEKFEKLKAILKSLSIDFTEEPRLVRGLDYYTGFVFEITAAGLGAQDAILGGGRYDNLVAELGGPKTPAVGFAFGIDRIARLMRFAEADDAAATLRPFIYLVGLGEAGDAAASKLTQALRRRFEDQTLTMSTRPEWIEQAFQARSLKANLREADRLGANYVIIIGDAELVAGKIVLREMSSGKQVELPIALDASEKACASIDAAIAKLMDERRMGNVS